MNLLVSNIAKVIRVKNGNVPSDIQDYAACARARVIRGSTTAAAWLSELESDIHAWRDGRGNEPDWDYHRAAYPGK